MTAENASNGRLLQYSDCAVCTMRPSTKLIETPDGFRARVCDNCLLALKAFLAPIQPVGGAG